MTSTIKADVVTAQTTNGDVTLQGNGTGGVTIQGQDYPTAGGLWSGRNMVINGAMNVSQRSTSVASITTAGYYALDRWQVTIVNGGTWTMSQDTDVPAAQGFLNSLKMDCTTADASFGAADYLYVRTKLEAQDCMRIRKGTANAEQVTVSFWTKSAKTGVHIVELLDNDNSRFVSASYTISSANTWENHSVTFPADTTGAFADDNGAGLGIHFYMGAGSNYTSGGSLGTTWGTTQANRAVGQVNVADDAANNWYLTGVQVEVGAATPFEHESYAETLQKCKRYYTSQGAGVTGFYNGATNMEIPIQLFPVMRATPTVAVLNSTPTISNKNSGGTGAQSNVALVNSSGTANGFYFVQVDNCGTSTSPAAGHLGQIRTDGFLSFAAEL